MRGPTTQANPIPDEVRWAAEGKILPCPDFFQHTRAQSYGVIFESGPFFWCAVQGKILSRVGCMKMVIGLPRLRCGCCAELSSILAKSLLRLEEGVLGSRLADLQHRSDFRNGGNPSTS